MMAKEFQDFDSDEQLSAFMDGEYDTKDNAPAVSIASDEHLQKTWQRYHLIRDVMQRDYTPTLSTDFAVQLNRKLEMEGLPGMPEQEGMQAAADNESNNIVPIADGGRSRRRHWMPVAGLAMAASAAAVFVGVNLNQFDQQGASVVTVAQLQPAEAEPAPEMSLAPDYSQGRVLPAVLISGSGTRWRGNEQTPRNSLVEQRLNSLLTNHLEDAAMGKVHGMLAHSRVVSYDSVSGTNDSF